MTGRAMSVLPQAARDCRIAVTGIVGGALRICIFGAGAIGVYLAAHLVQSGRCDVSVVARGDNLAAIAARGVRAITPGGDVGGAVRATDDTWTLGPQDYVFITVKAQQLDAALPQIAPLIGPRTCVLPPTTGVPYYFFHAAPGRFADRRLDAIDPDGRQWNVLPPAQALGCVYWIGAHLSAPGVAVQDGARAGAPLGELDGSISPRIAALSDMLQAGGLRAPIRPDIRGEIWVKFVNSLCWNPIAVLTGARMGEMAAAPGVLATVDAMMREADAVGTAIGLAIPTPPEQRIATTLSAPAHKMSMLQDLERGRVLELDPLQRSLTALTQLTGMSTPTLSTILDLAALRAATAATLKDAAA